ncbi:MAG: uroporphyrinogen decarboxylase family protein [Ardenticatenaceae bacterium]|nr:uroporphyrinogen decarboxylase family protein [Ardenticatenaceae bacterium]
MNKREAVLGLLDKDKAPAYIPAGFFIHFDPTFHRGQAAVDKHLAFFRHTGMDFVKIQYEDKFPHLPDIQKPADWAKMPLYGEDFYENQLSIAKGLLDAAQKEALIIMTLYSPLMCAASTTSRELLQAHMQADPEKVKQGLEIITESLMMFVKACIKLGIDGFYASTQGGEADRFGNSALFTDYVKPFDLALMTEMNRACIFNITHICDYHGSYDDLTPFLDYPGHVVNCSQQVGSERLSVQELSRMFDRPFMGGLDRLGIIARGSEEEIITATTTVCQGAPDRFILGADCTLPNDVRWDNIQTAIATAHRYQR